MKTIRWAGCKCRVERGKFDPYEIPLDCEATWNLISSGHTVGIFQLEKRLGQQWARRIKPRNMEELAALAALLRPGPLESEMTEQYAKIKRGEEQPEYLHPSLKPILRKTHSILTFQEQAIRIAVDVIGFSLAEADNLRKSIGKKDAQLMAELKKKWLDKATKRGIVDRVTAEQIFRWIEKFQRYGFNCAHAVSYAVLGYYTAWMKCHFPREFYSSYLTFAKFKSDPKEEIYTLVQDARLFGLDVLPPDIRRGNVDFVMLDTQEAEGIGFGLSHIKGVGDAALKRLFDGGGTPPQTWHEFLKACPRMHRNVAEALVRSGACDGYGLTRNEMLACLQAILGSTVRNDQGKQVEVRGLSNHEIGSFISHLDDCGGVRPTLSHMLEISAQVETAPSSLKKADLIEKLNAHGTDPASLDGLRKSDLLRLCVDRGIGKRPKAITSEARREIVRARLADLNREFPDTNTAKAVAEKHYLGIPISCSPADDADQSLASHTCLEAAKASNDAKISVVATIDYVKHTKTRRGENPGRPMCFLTLSDSTYSLDRCPVFPDDYENLKDLCKEDSVVLAAGVKKRGGLILNDLQKLL